MSRVTVGVPVYNGAQTLAETLCCIQQQVHQDIEVIVSIDAGDEGSAASVQPFLTDPRFRLVHQLTRQGWAANLTQTFLMGDAPFFCYWQQDDLASPNYLLELLASHQSQPNTSIAYTDVQWFGDRSGIEHLPSVDAPNPRDRVLDYLNSQHWIPLRGLIRSDLLRDLPAFARLNQYSPWENGFLAYLAGSAPMRRCGHAMYQKRAHQSQWGSSFDRRPPEQRRADWVVRANALLQALDHVSPAHVRADSTQTIVERFANAPPALFADYRYTEAPAPGRFVRDALALSPELWTDRIAEWARADHATALAEDKAKQTRTQPIKGATVWSLERCAYRDAEAYLGFGWSHRETWGVWSEVRNATLFLPPVERPGRLILCGTHHGRRGTPARVLWQIDGESAGEAAVDCGARISLPVPIMPGQHMLRLHLPDAMSPAELGMSNDGRQLGLGLHRMDFEPDWR